MPVKLISTTVKIGFWFTFLLLTYLVLVPPQYLAPEIFDWWDKLQHSLAFGVLTILGLLSYGYNQRRIGGMLIALAIYGAFIEVLQTLSGWRYGEFGDWFADLMGVLIAWRVFTYLQKRRYFSKFLKGL